MVGGCSKNGCRLYTMYTERRARAKEKNNRIQPGFNLFRERKKWNCVLFSMAADLMLN